MKHIATLNRDIKGTKTLKGFITTRERGVLSIVITIMTFLGDF